MATTNGSPTIDMHGSLLTARTWGQRRALYLLLPALLFSGAWIGKVGALTHPTPAVGVAAHPGTGYYLADSCIGCR